MGFFSGSGWGAGGGFGNPVTGAGGGNIGNTVAGGGGNIPSFSPTASGFLVYQTATGIAAYRYGDTVPPGSTFIGTVGPDGTVIRGGGGLGGVGAAVPRAVLQPVVTGGGNPLEPPEPPPLGEPPSPGFWEKEPQAAWMRRHQLPGSGQTAFQDWMMEQFAPTYGTFQAGKRLAAEPRSWAESTVEPLDARDLALGYLREAATRTPQQGREFRTDLGEQDFKGLILAALMGQYGAPIARRMAQRLPTLSDAYLAETGDPETGNFLRYLMEKYGLGE